MEAPTESPAPALTPASASLECRLCDVSFTTAEEKRQHAKSEWQIRCKVAEPGFVVPPPDARKSPSPKRQQDRKSQKTAQKPTTKADDQHVEVEESESDVELDSDVEPEADTVEFVPGQCLFCNHTSDDLDGNLAHMQQAHSLLIPFQDALAVDLQTLIWYLHMVIFSYRECICCGKRRRSVEAVQQHMTSLGHCRFDVSDELTEFYHMDSLAPHITGTHTYPDDGTLRLASGKLLGHRSHSESTPRGRLGGRSPASASSAALPTSQSNTDELKSKSKSKSKNTQALTKKDRQEQALTTQFSQLRTSDQMSLMHLPESQRRSLLASQKRELDKAKRAERRKRGKMDHVGNKVAIHTNYYKQEVPVYMGG